MAFVIVSSRNLARSMARTISLEFFVGLLVLILLLVLGLGVLIGNKLHRSTDALAIDLHSALSDPSAIPTEPPDPSPALVERIGELSARMVQLEIETGSLTERLDVVREFAQRMHIDSAVPLGPVARTPPAAGGPLLAPRLPDVESVDDVSGADLQGTGTDDLESAAQSPQATLTRIEYRIGKITRFLTELEQRAADVSLAHMAFPGRPPTTKGVKTSGFGNRSDPFRKKRAFHSGIDFAAPIGTPIHASAGGKVVFSGVLGGYGKTVEISHGAGLVTRYAHLSKLLVKKHQIVEPGQLIAKMGSTGRSTGPHLHFEILKDGHFVDPALYLKRF